MGYGQRPVPLLSFDGRGRQAARPGLSPQKGERGGAQPLRLSAGKRRGGRCGPDILYHITPGGEIQPVWGRREFPTAHLMLLPQGFRHCPKDPQGDCPLAPLFGKVRAACHVANRNKSPWVGWAGISCGARPSLASRNAATSFGVAALSGCMALPAGERHLASSAASSAPA